MRWRSGGTTPGGGVGAAGAHIHFDLMDPKIRESPWQAYRQLQESSPVYRIPGPQPIYVLSRYQDVRASLMDPKRFSSQPRPGRAAPFLIGMDDPDHRRVRRLSHVDDRR